MHHNTHRPATVNKITPSISTTSNGTASSVPANTDNDVCTLPVFYSHKGMYVCSYVLYNFKLYIATCEF